MARSSKALLKPALPAYVEPCLPTLVEKAPTGAQWIHEIKHDGYRLGVRIHAGDVRLLSRRGLAWTTRFPLVHQAAGELRLTSAYIDGEVVIEVTMEFLIGPLDIPALRPGRCPQAVLWGSRGNLCRIVR